MGTYSSMFRVLIRGIPPRNTILTLTHDKNVSVNFRQRVGRDISRAISFYVGNLSLGRMLTHGGAFFIKGLIFKF